MKYTLLALIISLTLQSQVNPTNNVICLDVSTMPQNTSFNYDSCLAIGSGVGIGSVGLTQLWTSVETSPMNYNFTIFDIANLYYPAKGMAVDLTLAPINTNVKEVPSDLTSTAFSSTVMISRFNRLLDSIKVHTPNLTLSSLIIGSEHDVYLGSNATLWADYTVFYNAVLAHAKILWPGLKVATELTFDGIINYNIFSQNLNTNSDYIGVSYYPLTSSFSVKPVSTIPADFASLVSLYPSKKINFYQYGYPSSTVCASSDLQQKQFITQTFSTWDTYSNNIRMIDFTWLHDLDVATVNAYGVYYGITNPAFLEFLRTIGLRTWNNNGTDKLALDELRCQAKTRGFNTLPITCSPMTINEANLESKNLIYPNPTGRSFEMTLKNNSNLKVCDITGKLLFERYNYNGGKIEVDKLERGIYFVIAEENGNILTTKLIIE